ncbi:hypothetical protein WJX73_003390 [Symbiochloris irregularis]|uniref:Uncharacterized protein n=1 Tax=Symbiochloris irregularis TaxID=706552 RepID=A0AAW1P5A0_9CHLO
MGNSRVHNLPQRCLWTIASVLGFALIAHATPGCPAYLGTQQPETDYCATKVVKIAQYQWVPHKCNFDTFDAQRLSKLVGKRRVLLVGDSIMMQQFVSLKNLMRPVTDPLDEEPAGWNHFLTVDGGRWMQKGRNSWLGLRWGSQATQTWKRFVAGTPLV